MQHRVVSHDEWLAARKAHLRNEKALTRMRDLVSAERRTLPWAKVEKDYVFDTTESRKSLAELFDGRSQLIIHHFMFAPDWEAGCPSCSLEADHAEARSFISRTTTSPTSASRARRSRSSKPTADAWAGKARWASSYGSDFNHDFHVSFTPEELAQGKVHYNYDPVEGYDELPGLSVFYKGEDGCVFYKDEDGCVFHTYSSYARGNEEVNGVFIYLDITPKGRNEKEIMDWVRRHDEYEGPSQETPVGAAAVARA